MALYQPTNVTPSLSGALGNGIADITKGLTVSWQVNGNSPMTAFQITIYENDASSTQVYTTGKLTDNCPFYNTTTPSNMTKVKTVFFSYSISASVLTSAGMANGKEYKIVITQWWSDTESVVQSSASVFKARASATLEIADVAQEISTKSYTFSAVYAQAQGDILNWIEWQLYDSQGDILYDTGKLYSTSDMQFTYDGFFTGETYSVRCFGQTSNNEEIESDEVTFNVLYDTMPTQSALTASCVQSGVKISWAGLVNIPATANGEYSIDNGMLNLSIGSVIWDNVNNAPMDFKIPWGVIWRGEIPRQTATLYTAGNVTLTYWRGDGNLTFNTHPAPGSAAILDQFDDVAMHSINPGDIATVILTPTKAYYYIEQKVDYLAPNEMLYPASTLYPRTPRTVLVSKVHEVQYQQVEITSVLLHAPQKGYYVQILKGEPANYMQWFAPNYTPAFDGNTYFLADFKNELQAGNISEDITAVGYSIYRRKNNETNIRHIGDTDYTVNTIYDYSVRNQGGEYTYYMFTIGTDKYATAPLTSNTVTPLTWEWTLLDCEERENGIYNLKAKYSFGKNLTSGSISNNNSPNILNNFTRYPKVQLAPQNYQSGTLQSLIGAVGFNVYGKYVYSDSIELRDAIYNLSATTDALFLKNRKGDVLKIQIAGAITMSTSDSTREQIQTASIPWVEVGDAKDISIIATEEIKDMDSGADVIVGGNGNSGGSNIPQKWLPLTGGTLTGLVTFEAGADMADNRITSVGAPESASDAANREYVDEEIKEAAPIVINNVSVQTSAFHADSTYPQFPYAATISISGTTANDVPEVIFAAKDVATNNFASVCSSITNGVFIYSTAVPEDTIVIPTIIINKGV